MNRSTIVNVPTDPSNVSTASTGHSREGKSCINSSLGSSHYSVARQQPDSLLCLYVSVSSEPIIWMYYLNVGNYNAFIEGTFLRDYYEPPEPLDFEVK